VIIRKIPVVSSNRAQRIADRIREELAEMLIFDIKDQRLSDAFITDVRVDRELAFADIYVSSLQGSDAAQEILAGCKHAIGFLRSELARRIDLRTFPQLRFHWDPTPEQAEHIEQMLDELNIQDSPDSGGDHLRNE
jgi:ribosome-binding factor A